MDLNDSKQLWERAKAAIVGGVNSPVRSFKYVDCDPIYFSHADGAFLWDVAGKKYVDLCLSFGPHILGHGHEALKKALKEQIDQGLGFGANHRVEIEAAEKVLSAYPFLDRVRFVNSGTEAVMTAIRIARGFTQRSKILKFEGCYHGHSDGLLVKAGSGVAHIASSSSAGVPASLVKDTLVARLDHEEQWRSAIKHHAKELAAVIVEPIAANHGLYIPEREPLHRLVQTCREAGVVVIFDEVISGFRVGWSGACGFYDLQPDLVTLGKIIGGGLPIGAVAGTERIMNVLAPVGDVYQAGTLSGNLLATRACVTVLDWLNDHNPYVSLADSTENFCRRLEPIVRSFGGRGVKFLASMFWVDFSKGDGFPASLDESSTSAFNQFYRFMLNAGVYLPPSPYEVGFVSTAHTPDVMDALVEKIEKSL